MAFTFNGKFWVATKTQLDEVLYREKLLAQHAPTTDRPQAHRLIGNIVARYVVLCNNLSEIYDQTLQVQKRPVVEKVLKSATKRLFELQREMQKVEMSEFICLDDALVELKLTPQNIEFLRPFYFPRKREVEVQQLIDEVPPPVTVTEPLKGLNKYRKVFSEEEVQAKLQREKIDAAVTLIKTHEKAKQARVRWLNIKLFPKTFRIDPPVLPTFPYDFIHKPDQVPLFKIRRKEFKTNFQKPKVNVPKFAFYEPPTYRLNRLGHKVIVKKKVVEAVEQVVVDEASESDDVNAVMKMEEARKLEADKEEEEFKKKTFAAVAIQRCFRRHLIRKELERKNIKRMELFGMIEKEEDFEKQSLKSIDEKFRQKRRERKKVFDETFLKALEDEKARIVKLKSGSIMEDISDDIRQWFKEFYDSTKDFHRYPEEFEGGTIMVIRCETKSPDEFLIQKNKTEAQKSNERNERRKKKKEAKVIKKKQEVQAKKMEATMRKRERKYGPTWDFADKKFRTANVDELEKTFFDYKHEWQFIDEMANRTESPIWDWVTIDAYADVHLELRRVVDGLMRIELEILRFARSIDNKTRYAPAKAKKPKKKRKKKTAVDVTEGQRLDECYEELKALNIIRKYPKRSLDDYIGDYNFAAHELRLVGKNPTPHYGDIKNTLRSMVLGMGPLKLPKVKSLCIAGPAKCGKKFLVEALCTEIDALLIDLSPKRVAKIENLEEVLAFVMEMAKKLQPTVIFIDGAHKSFIRKIAQEEVADSPAKLGKFLLRSVVKKLNADDAVMLIATTNQPWNCNFGALRKCYEKIVAFPPTLDYGTALMTWTKGLKTKNIRNFDATALARVTRNYTTGDILEFIESHVNLRRRMRLMQNPLTCNELLVGIMNAKVKLDDKTIDAFMSFMLKIDPYVADRADELARMKQKLGKLKTKAK